MQEERGQCRRDHGAQRRKDGAVEGPFHRYAPRLEEEVGARGKHALQYSFSFYHSDPTRRCAAQMVAALSRVRLTPYRMQGNSQSEFSFQISR